MHRAMGILGCTRIFLFIPCAGQNFSEVLPFIVVWFDNRLTRQVKGLKHPMYVFKHVLYVLLSEMGYVGRQVSILSHKSPRIIEPNRLEKTFKIMCMSVFLRDRISFQD